MYDRYEGTVIGADGKRYENDAQDIPTEAPAMSGSFVTKGALEPIEDAIADHETRIGTLETAP